MAGAYLLFSEDLHGRKFSFALRSCLNLIVKKSYAVFLPHRQIVNIEFHIENLCVSLCAYDSMWFKCHVMLSLLYNGAYKL